MSAIHNEKVILKSANKCCICFRTGIIAHHIIFKENEGPDDFENLAPLCPNCHDGAHTKSTMTKNLTGKIIRKFKDSWYKTVEEHRVQLKEIDLNFEDRNTNLISLLKYFYLFAESKKFFPSISIKLAFSQYLPTSSEAEKLRSIEVFDYLRDGLNYGDIKAIMGVLKSIYSLHLKKDAQILTKFNEICKSIGIVTDEL